MTLPEWRKNAPKIRAKRRKRLQKRGDRGAPHPVLPPRLCPPPGGHARSFAVVQDGARTSNTEGHRLCSPSATLRPPDGRRRCGSSPRYRAELLGSRSENGGRAHSLQPPRGNYLARSTYNSPRIAGDPPVHAGRFFYALTVPLSPVETREHQLELQV
ncbi:hypothetical protein MRX96_029297 [Rhipicephalus microplus]